MKAPEKIYMPIELLSEEWTRHVEGQDIEYTRTDAVIEKAVKYVANHFLAPGMDNEINDFVNYMKGE